MKVTPILIIHLNLLFILKIRVILNSSYNKNMDLLHAKTAKMFIGKKLSWVDISSLFGWFFVHRC